MEKRINKHVYTWVGAFIFGEIGVDRFMRGQIGIGILKLILCGLCVGVASLVTVLTAGLGFALFGVFMAPIYLWWFIDWIIALTKLGKYKEDFVFADGKWTDGYNNRVGTAGEETDFASNGSNLAESTEDFANAPREAITYTSKEGFACSERNGKITITGYNGEAKDVVIPDRINNLPVTTIGGSSFAGMRLTNITIPNTITCIEGSAFYRNKLRHVTIPNSVTDIGWGAFDFKVKVTRQKT